MKNNHIALYIDLLFCLVIMPLTIMLLPVDRWIVHNKAFLLTLIFYVYALYFVYRRTCIPKLFKQKKIHTHSLTDGNARCHHATTNLFSDADQTQQPTTGSGPA